MGKNIFCALIIAGLCFGQSKKNIILGIQENAFCRNLSIEALGKIDLTFEYDLGFQGAKLPTHIWGGSCRIDYQFSPPALVSCAGGYSHTGNLSYIDIDYGISEMNYSGINFSLLFSYTDANCTAIGGGIDISRIMVLYKNWVPLGPTDTLVNISIGKVILVRPMLSASVQSQIISPLLYIKIQIESRILQFAKFSSKEIDLPKVLPSILIGLGYRFNF